MKKLTLSCIYRKAVNTNISKFLKMNRNKKK